ncbi:MAG: hypothetical protein GXO30_07295 [Epsilonproteobacteria bacterium]|nr:hypothetical protein [Campylobacterota bacterium]
MLIYGHKFIPSENFYHVINIDAILNTPPNSTIYLDFTQENLEIINYASLNSISLAISVSNITQSIYASSLGSDFIIVDKELAKSVQDIANNYLFDAKILVNIKSENEIEELALQGIDGVIFSNAIIKTNS